MGPPAFCLLFFFIFANQGCEESMGEFDQKIYGPDQGSKEATA